MRSDDDDAASELNCSLLVRVKFPKIKVLAQNSFQISSFEKFVTPQTLSILLRPLKLIILLSDVACLTAHFVNVFGFSLLLFYCY